MEKMVLTLHIIVCVVLVILVLLQSGKEGMGVIFGGGSSSLFGSTGAGGILVKLTTFVAVLFLATSLGYNMLTSVKSNTESTIIDLTVDDPTAPAKPEVPAATNSSAPAAATNASAPAAANASAPAAANASTPAETAPAAPAPAEPAPANATTPTAPAAGQ